MTKDEALFILRKSKEPLPIIRALAARMLVDVGWKPSLVL